MICDLAKKTVRSLAAEFPEDNEFSQPRMDVVNPLVVFWAQFCSIFV